MTRAVSKFEVVPCIRVPEQHTIEPRVIFERTQDGKAQAIAIKLHKFRQIVRRAGDTQMSGL